MKRMMNIQATAPQYSVTTDISYAQVDAWYGHTRQDLKLDLIYPEDRTRLYPCIVWICGGAWLKLDKSAHLAYLSALARQGFVVASVQYRTSNEAQFPAQLQDVKAAIRYLRAHAERYRIQTEFFGVMGESAGGHLTCMAALANDPAFDVGDYLEYSSAVQAACPWYPPTDFCSFPYRSVEECAGSPESLLMGKNSALNREDAYESSPIRYIRKDAPPFMIIHGNMDHTVPYAQGELLHDKLEALGCDVTLLTLDQADHADIRFFQQVLWDEIGVFFKSKLCR